MRPGGKLEAAGASEVADACSVVNVQGLFRVTAGRELNMRDGEIRPRFVDVVLLVFAMFETLAEEVAMARFLVLTKSLLSWWLCAVSGKEKRGKHSNEWWMLAER